MVSYPTRGSIFEELLGTTRWPGGPEMAKKGGALVEKCHKGTSRVRLTY